MDLKSDKHHNNNKTSSSTLNFLNRSIYYFDLHFLIYYEIPLFANLLTIQKNQKFIIKMVDRFYLSLLTKSYFIEINDSNFKNR